MLSRRHFGLAMLGAFFVAVYLRVLRPWQLRWGATEDETIRPLPGDEVVPNPTFNATRAVTIMARPEEIWPWLVQIGLRRAGWYSFDWIDNLGQPSAQRLIPEFQQLAIGDFIPMSPIGRVGQWVKEFEPNRWLLWWDNRGDVSWLWFLDPADERHTRLITRVRMRYRWASPTILFNLLLDVGDIVMMRKSLLGIKQRAERPAESPSVSRRHAPQACPFPAEGSQLAPRLKIASTASAIPSGKGAPRT